MTPDEFRGLALELPGVVEASHMGHPDFRRDGKIFATLRYPDANTGMVKVPVEEQRRLLEAWPDVFVPASGAWGRQGSTMVKLPSVNADTVAEAMQRAWEFAGVGKAAARKKAKARGK